MEIKSITEFSFDPTHRDSYHSVCKKCINEKAKIWYKMNKKRKNNYDKEYQQVNKEHLRNVKHDYYIENKYFLNKEHHEYYQKNKERLKDYQKQYNEHRKGTSDYIYENKVRNFKRRQNGYVRKKTIQMIYEDNIKKFGTLTCILCNNPIVFGQDSIEHLIPLCKGGTHEYNNLGVSHRSCNKSKGRKTFEEFISHYPRR